MSKSMGGPENDTKERKPIRLGACVVCQGELNVHRVATFEGIELRLPEPEQCHPYCKGSCPSVASAWAAFVEILKERIDGA